jgi:hypothetical protein
MANENPTIASEPSKTAQDSTPRSPLPKVGQLVRPVDVCGALGGCVHTPVDTLAGTKRFVAGAGFDRYASSDEEDELLDNGIVPTLLLVLLKVGEGDEEELR